MCLSAIIDCQWPLTTPQLFNMIDSIQGVYNSQDFLREAIQILIKKILTKNAKSLKLFEYICLKFKLEEVRILSTSADLSLFLMMKGIYLKQYPGASQKVDQLMSYSDFFSKKNLALVCTLLK